MVSKKTGKKNYFFLLFLIGKIRHGIGKKGGYFLLGWAENPLVGKELKVMSMCLSCFISASIHHQYFSSIRAQGEQTRYVWGGKCYVSY